MEGRELKREARGNSRVWGPLLGGTVVLALGAILLARDPNVFWNDDYQLSILPVFADMARSWSEGELPLLSPYSWVCSNLAGEFQYGTFSVFINAAVVLIWQLPFTFAQQAAALSMAHLFVLATGSFVLAQSRGFSTPLAVMVALVGAANGWVICWGATDWFGALGALAWLPWAWWGFERALDPARGRWRFVWPAPFVYLLIAGGFPYTVLMLALLAGWLGIKSIFQTRSLISVIPAVIGVLLGAGLSAPAWLALLDYVSGSARQGLEASAHSQWVVPPAALPAFILPSWTVDWADFSTRLMPHTGLELASGFVPPVAVLAALVLLGTSYLRAMKWELGLLGIVLIISMLPSANVFRWSFRWLPFLHLILGLCAAAALQHLAAARHRDTSLRRWLSSPGSMGALLLLAMAAAMVLRRDLAPPEWSRHSALLIAMLLLSLAWAGSELLSSRRQKLRDWTPAVVTFMSLLAAYVFIPTNVGVPKYHLAQDLIQPEPLDARRLYLSVYPPPEEAYRLGKREGAIGQTVRPGSTSMWAGHHFINGYSPIRPAGVAREFDVAIHGNLPAWARDYFVEWEAGPDEKLAQLGIDGIIVAREFELKPLPAEEWEVAAETNEGRVFHRRGGPLARVRSVPSDETGAQYASASINLIEDSRHRMIADVAVPAGAQPALLTFSRPFFPGYRAELNGQSLPVESVRSLMPIVKVPAGTSGRLTLRYRPWWLATGGGIALISLAICIAAGVANFRRR